MDSHPIIFGFPVRYGHYLYFFIFIFIFGFPVSSRSLVVTSDEPFRLPTSHLASGPTVPLHNLGITLSQIHYNLKITQVYFNKIYFKISSWYTSRYWYLVCLPSCLRPCHKLPSHQTGHRRHFWILLLLLWKRHITENSPGNKLIKIAKVRNRKRTHPTKQATHPNPCWASHQQWKLLHHKILRTATDPSVFHQQLGFPGLTKQTEPKCHRNVKTNIEWKWEDLRLWLHTRLHSMTLRKSHVRQHCLCALHDFPSYHMQPVVQWKCEGKPEKLRVNSVVRKTPQYSPWPRFLPGEIPQKDLSESFFRPSTKRQGSQRLKPV